MNLKSMALRFNVMVLVLISSLSCPSLGSLQIGFYSKTCPNAESIVSRVVKEATEINHSTPAFLLRLHYHDCFVQGCDGSVLIDKPDEEGPEKLAQNHQGLNGFNVIDDAKSKLEEQCQGIVSCADIVALAARDSIALSQGPIYQVPTGRRDGMVSRISDADNMPDINDPVEALKAKFAEKGLSDKDLVLLSGAHTIGTAACFFITHRLYNFSPGGGADPLINQKFLSELQSECPKGGDILVRVPLDRGSGTKFDAKIFKNIQSGFGVLDSDAKIYTDTSMKTVIDSYVASGDNGSRPSFGSDFVESVVRMGKLGVKTGQEGEVRRVCSKFN